MHNYIIDIILMVLGIAGFLLAHHIYKEKHKKKPLICPLRSNCDLVVHSDYSKFFHIPVEILGMIYYASVVLLHAIVVFYPNFFTLLTVRLSLATSAIAFLFSMYLISVQAFVLKQWCTWCLCSAGLCVAIFATTYLASPVGLF